MNLSVHILFGHVIADGESASGMPNNGDENPQGEPNREQPSDTDAGCSTDIDEDESDLVPQRSLERRVSLKTQESGCGTSEECTVDVGMNNDGTEAGASHSQNVKVPNPVAKETKDQQQQQRNSRRY